MTNFIDIIIYEMLHLESGKVFYVGQAEDLTSRFISHMEAAITNVGNGNLRQSRNAFIRDNMSDIAIRVVKVVRDDGSGIQSLDAEKARYDELVKSGRSLMQKRPATPKKRAMKDNLDILLDNVLRGFDTFKRY